MKTVNVRMSDECHAILKAYCSFINKTMSDVMYEFARQELHQQSLCCKPMQALLDFNSKERDCRAHKPCWGFRCYLCNHEKACRVGKDDRLFILQQQLHHHVKDSHDHVKYFDGSTVDVCPVHQCFTKLN